MNLSFVLLFLSMGFYIAAFVCHLVSFFGIREEAHRLAFGLMRIGFLVSTFYFLEAAGQSHYFLPVYHISPAMAFFAWSLAFVYLVLFVKIQRESFGLILTPILVLFTALACLRYEASPPADPGLSNAYFTLHIVSAFFAYACFTVSFAAGVLYLIQQHELKSKHAGRFYHKLPALEALEKLIFQPMIWGAFLLFTAIGVGFLWSKSAFGTFWFFDAKTLATLVTVAMYFAILYMHYISSLRGKRVVVFSLVAFGMVLFSFVGMRFIEGSHYFVQ